VKRIEVLQLINGSNTMEEESLDSWLFFYSTKQGVLFPYVDVAGSELFFAVAKCYGKSRRGSSTGQNTNIFS